MVSIHSSNLLQETSAIVLMSEMWELSHLKNYNLNQNLLRLKPDYSKKNIQSTNLTGPLVKILNSRLKQACCSHAD